MRPIAYLLCLAVLPAHAQETAADALREGDGAYRKSDLEAAANAYERALALDAQDARAAFNLGNVRYRQERYADAQRLYRLSAERATGNDKRAHAYHNLGNSLLAENKPADAIEAYKQALRLDPADEDTRYNLAYAQRMKKQQEQQQDQQQDKDQQDKNDGQKDQQQDQQQQDQENKDQQGKEGEQQQDKQQQRQQERMSRQEAERILEALEHQEQQVQQKVREKQRVGVKVPTEKDW